MNSIQQYLPSRRMVGFVIVPLITIFSLWFIGYARDAKQERMEEQKAYFTDTLNSAIVEYNRRDTDGDLLQDWEEFLYETDIENIDSDGDGLDDYQEVLDPIRDPLVADSELGRTVAATSSPNDVIGEGPYYAYDESLNTTEKFSRDIFNTFAQVQQSEDPELVEQVLVERVAENAASREREVSDYTIADISVVPSVSEVQDKALYLNQYTEIIGPLEVIAGMRSELQMVEEYVQYKNPQSLEGLVEIANLYGQFIDSLLEMRVSSDIAEVHLELINNYDIQRKNILKMSRMDTDPIAGIAGTSAYFDDNALLQQTLYALSLYLHGK